MSISTDVEGESAGLLGRITTAEASVPEPLRSILRGIGQVFFQENAVSGGLFVLGIFLGSPLMALGAVVGSALGYATGRVARFNRGDLAAGIHGFNPALVGIATFFFFGFGLQSLVLLAVGCVASTFVTFAMRRFLPFPTYTTPFIVVTWVLHAVGNGLGVAAAGGNLGLVPDPPLPFVVAASAHGVSQVMFQGSLWTALLFLAGIAAGNRGHAAWVLLGSIMGMLLASHNMTEATRSIDPEALVDRPLHENIALGLYGYNATLVPVALFLWRRAIVAPLLGIVLTVPIAELVPRLGVPALTAPFVIATWVVLALGKIESKFLSEIRRPAS